jgi:hypothetical protein
VLRPGVYLIEELQHFKKIVGQLKSIRSIAVYEEMKEVLRPFMEELYKMP